jgi:hypothetical protein
MSPRRAAPDRHKYSISLGVADAAAAPADLLSAGQRRYLLYKIDTNYQFKDFNGW